MTESLVKKACDLLESKTGFVMATIIGHQGSTPRTAGARMIVTGDGQFAGTIGGGLLEARTIQKAVKIIAENSCSAFMPFDLSCDDVAGMDMICGGKAEIFLDHVSASCENEEIFNQWHRILNQRQNGFFLTEVSDCGKGCVRVSRGVLDQDRVLCGDFPIYRHLDEVA